MASRSSSPAGSCGRTAGQRGECEPREALRRAVVCGQDSGGGAAATGRAAADGEGRRASAAQELCNPAAAGTTFEPSAEAGLMAGRARVQGLGRTASVICSLQALWQLCNASITVNLMLASLPEDLHDVSTPSVECLHGKEAVWHWIQARCIES